jgi:hypothetical protein
MLNSGFTNHDHYKRPEILAYYKEILFPIKINKKTGYSCYPVHLSKRNTP